MNSLFKELKDELYQGLTEKAHPFRFFTLGTISSDKKPKLRTVVLREISKNFNLIFYTDARSKKLKHIKANNAVCLLFYHPEKLIQITITGIASISNDESLLEKKWNDIPLNNRKDYTTRLDPGSIIPESDSITYLENGHHLSMVEIEPLKIEYLKLKQPHHEKVLFSKIENTWKSEFLVP